MAKSSPPTVLEAYQKQFYADFRTFLQLRSKEVVQGGSMVLTILGRSISDPTSDDCCCFWELLAQSLVDMVKVVCFFYALIRYLDLPQLLTISI